MLTHFENKNEKDKNSIIVRVHDFHAVREEIINLNSGKDRRKLSYILQYEHFKLKKKDLEYLQNLLDNYSSAQAPKPSSTENQISNDI